MLSLPSPRGPISAYLLEQLARRPYAPKPVQVPDTAEPLGDDDLQLALYLCYELHYRGLPGVDESWEWEPSLLAFRAELERRFEAALLAEVPLGEDPVSAAEIDLALREIAEQDGPPLSSYIRSQASLEQVRAFVVHRSASRPKEALRHAWAIARLSGSPKPAV